MTKASDPKLHTYRPDHAVALDPKAFGGLFAAIDVARDPFHLRGNVAIVEVSGPLTQDSFFFTTYESIVSNVEAALDSEATTVILDMRSPGGDTAGMLDAAHAIRAAADATGKRVITYVSSQASSAAYALAVATDKIVISPMGSAGSVGVVRPRLDASEAAVGEGVKLELITSGARKRDGHPGIPLSDEERAATQRDINFMASVFFEWVVSRRESLTPEILDDLQGASFIGEQAVTRGFADEVMTRVELLDALAGESITSNMADTPKDDDESKATDEEKDEAREALVNATKSSDEAKAAKARKALKAYDAQDEEDEDDDKEESSSASEGEASAATATPAATAAAKFGEATAKRVQELEAWKQEQEAKAEAHERAEFFAQYELSNDQIKAFDGVPLDQAQKILSDMGVKQSAHKGRSPLNPAAASPAPTLGDRQRTSPRNPDIAAAMGLGKVQATNEFDGVQLKLGVAKHTLEND